MEGNLWPNILSPCLLDVKPCGAFIQMESNLISFRGWSLCCRNLLKLTFTSFFEIFNEILQFSRPVFVNPVDPYLILIGSEPHEIKSMIKTIKIFSVSAWLILQLTIAQAAETIRIASIFALSGPSTEAHVPSVLGVRWAVEQINQAGGVLGKPLTLIELDNRGTPIGSKIAADEAVQSEVCAIIGPAWSSHSIAAAKVAQANGIPLISNISTSPDVTKIGDYIFRVCYNDLLQGRVMAEFARREADIKRVIILRDLSSDYSISLSKTFQAVFEKMGGTVLKTLAYRGRQTNFMNIIQEIKSSRPDAIFLPGHDDSGVIISEMSQNGLHLPVLGGDGWDVNSFFLQGGDKLEHGYYATHWHEAAETEPSKAFYMKYKGRNPFLAPAALSYDAVLLLTDAIRRAGTVKRSAVRDALAATKEFQGVTGTLAFNSDRDPMKSLVIMKITHGQPAFYKQVMPLAEDMVAGNGR